MISLIQLEVGAYAWDQVRAEMQINLMQRSIPLQVATTPSNPDFPFLYTLNHPSSSTHRQSGLVVQWS